MKKLLKEHWKETVKVFLFIIIMSYIAVLASGWLQSGDVQEKVLAAGYWGPIIITLYVAASQVVAPLAGTPGIVVALSVYGFAWGWLMTYLGSLLSATINFYIARYLGRNWVIRLAGKKSISRIDKFVKIMGTRLLIMARLVGFPLYEFISYAVGFTNMSFNKYFLITAIFSLIPGTLTTLIVYRSLASPFAMSVFMGSVIIIGIIFTWYTVKLYLDSQKKN